jgi:hypothetical protein
VAKVLVESSSLNGYVVDRNFYPSAHPTNVDVSLCFPLPNGADALVSIRDAGNRSVSEIASISNRHSEAAMRSSKISQSGGMSGLMRSLLPQVLLLDLYHVRQILLCKYGLRLPAFLSGSTDFLPYGVATIVWIPAQSQCQGPLDISITSDLSDSSASIVMTLVQLSRPGGTPQSESGPRPPIAVSISIDNAAASTLEGYSLVTRLRKELSS